MQITIDGDAAVEQQFREMPERTQKAMIRSLNRGINSAKTLMVSRLSKDVGLKSKDVRDALPVTQATFSRPVARLATSLKRIPLIKFGARGPEPSRGRGNGVSYRLPSGNGRVSKAFITTMASGHRGVFVRKAQARLPIRELFGPSLGHVFAKYRAEALARAREMFETNLARELKWRDGQGVTSAGTE